MIIFSRGVDVIPCTLEIGDYILSPKIAVERKSPSDLSQSLKSGRLYKQCQALSNAYSKAILLIEFADVSSFILKFSSYDGELDVPSRLVLLCLHFPKIKLLWSSSPTESALLFDELQVMFF